MFLRKLLIAPENNLQLEYDSIEDDAESGRPYSLKPMKTFP